MKDLKHYFTDNAKACETSNVEAKEVTPDTVNDNASNEEQASGLSRRKKRGRVKIKISQSNSRGKVCDIIDSKSDLIDKTPSPFTLREHKVDECLRNDTPKRSKSLPRKSSKNSKSNGVASSTSKSENENVTSGDENDNLISNMTEVGNAHTSLIQSTDSSFERISTMGREESNAFQVLMTRKKSIQYREPVPLSLNDEELAAKIIEERKIKLKQNREKLTVMANKKGYMKRKINEAEDAEMIEIRLEKRAKVFRQMGKKETEDKPVAVSHRRVSPGSLHNYFIPSTVQKKDKEPVILCDADNSDSSVTIINEDIALTKTIPLCSDKPVDEAKSPSSQRSKKPKWSLRINLHCNDRNVEDDPVVEKNDKALQGQKESKPRHRKVKTCSYEETSSCEVETLKPRKRKSFSKIRNSNTSSGAESPSIEQSKSSLSIDTAIEKAEIDQSIEPEILEIKVIGKPEKLAPLFVKRSKPDPAVLEARRAFLYSAPAENESRKLEPKLPIVTSQFLPFPTIGHVTQLSTETPVNKSLKLTYPMREIKPYVPSFDLKEFESLTSLGKDVSKKLNDSIETTKSSPEEVLSEIESRCADARKLWARISTKSKNLKPPRISPKKQRSRRRKTADKSEPVECINHDCVWTQKYRPTNTDDIVGNEEAAGKFREWLNRWTANGQKDFESSGDEFYPSDCSLISNVNNQVAVLLGPHGSGKTASVYAIAEELGYSVLEVNASSKRTGKKISKELEEATKSHRIKHPEVMLFKSKTRTNDTKLSRNSLILIEDVDLIFEEDEGFIAATFQLASNTKRPIVMTGKDTCSHLSRMAPDQLRIYYQTAVGSRVAALLELITLAECGHRLPKQCLDRLLQNGDLRKAVLQLQYLLLSGKPSASSVPTNFYQSLWQDMRSCIYKPAIRAMKKSTKKKHSHVEKTQLGQESIIMNNMAKDLENVSFLSTLIDVDDPAFHHSNVKVEESLSLDENTHEYSSASSTNLEIAEWLRERVMNNHKAIISGNELQNMRQLLVKKELNIGVNSALAHVSPHSPNHRSTVLDYLPSIRTICRAEQIRTTCNNKRGNRFFHYLQNLRLPTYSTRPSILTAACKIMCEKSSES